MAEHRIEIGIVVAKKTLSDPWSGQAWLPHAALPAAPAIAAWTPLGSRDGITLFYAGAYELALHSGATAHYRDNLRTRQPMLWIALSSAADVCRAHAVTADPYEGEALTQGLDATVEAVPMPEAVRAEIAAFVDAFHVERPFIKRERDRANPEALGFRPVVERRRSRR
jgi:hypothetical protein